MKAQPIWFDWKLIHLQDYVILLWIFIQLLSNLKPRTMSPIEIIGDILLYLLKLSKHPGMKAKKPPFPYKAEFL